MGFLCFCLVKLQNWGSDTRKLGSLRSLDLYIASYAPISRDVMHGTSTKTGREMNLERLKQRSQPLTLIKRF